MGHNSGTFWPVLKKLRYAHLHVSGIMYSKFHSDDLTTVREV